MTRTHRLFPAAQSHHLLSPLRKVLHSPERLLGPHISKGDTVIDFGCGPGFFSLPMARMVGESGIVIAADVQEEMLAMVKKAATDQGLVSRVRLHLSRGDSLGITESLDISFALLFHVLHETSNPAAILAELYRVLRPGGHVLIAEPWFVVRSGEFAETLCAASRAGFAEVSSPFIVMSRTALLRKIRARS